ncbi:MAG: hypothetical protein AABY22_14700 [Nanoarchaeota archaeon]
MALKDWKKSSKYDSEQYSMLINTLPKYKDFKNNYYITYGDNGKSYWMSITKQGKQIKFQTFGSKWLLLKTIKDYMRSH